MLNEKSTRAKIGITAIAVGLIGFIIAIFLPTIMTETLHFSRDNIVLVTPKSNSDISFLSLGLIVATLILLALKHTKLTYSLAAVTIIAIIGFYSWTLGNYIAIQDEQIIIKSYTNEQVTKWSDIQAVFYEYSEDAQYGQYIFHTANDKIIIDETPKFGPDEKQKIYDTARSYHIAFTEQASSK